METRTVSLENVLTYFKASVNANFFILFIFLTPGCVPHNNIYVNAWQCLCKCSLFCV